MKKSSFLFSVIVMALTANVWASSDDQRIIDAAQKHPITIAEALQTADETAVMLTGTIQRQVKDEHYELKDATGSIAVEIDKKLASAAQLKQGTVVKVLGEVDTHRYKPTDIDVVKVEFVK